MGEIVLGSEAVATGHITRARLRWRYRALYPDVYVPRDDVPTLRDRSVGAWLWSGRRAVITGRAAAALHGAKWVDEQAPIEMLWPNNRAPEGIVTRRERIADDEMCDIDGMSVATPARVALDLARHQSRVSAVTHLDALVAATRLRKVDAVALAERYAGAKRVAQCREAFELMDGGAQSPKESWLRLLLVDSGFPRPQTQIPVHHADGYPFAYLDMGWPKVKIAVEYDGDQHRTDRAQYAWDVRRLRALIELGWIHVRVINEDSARDVVDRVRRAWAQREREAMVVKRPA
ncbi:type IV toxin-antitoxin system AbiEi family antitoxin [Mycobacterium sp. IDR2000157661]|uniref:type IV toxin-antitoxin system AbiEi family antitoxin n=1 Tax=Mycobacterium sp. IDR2000157661 TaxID=2867005 RepID=UPI001EE9B4E8|nr:type IV toxin-antitoxin system AbiEi family antitoxin [Mycobacterium sp. IDR2000157661]ULE33936.1 hypothetical protein K3G64_04385 [Mycobacterium sp. IDR2000157661]